MLRKGFLFDVLPHISPYIIPAIIVNQFDSKIPCLLFTLFLVYFMYTFLALSICLLVYDIHNMVSLKLERPFISNTLKKVRYLHHCEFISKCLHHKVIPKGLTLNANINALGLPSSRFLKRAKGIMQKASLDMMTLLLV